MAGTGSQRVDSEEGASFVEREGEEGKREREESAVEWRVVYI